MLGKARRFSVFFVGSLHRVKGNLQDIGWISRHEHVEGDADAPHVRLAGVCALEHFGRNVKGGSRKGGVVIRQRGGLGRRSSSSRLGISSRRRQRLLRATPEVDEPEIAPGTAVQEHDGHHRRHQRKVD